MIPLNNSLLKIFWNPDKIVECRDFATVDGFRRNFVRVFAAKNESVDCIVCFLIRQDPSHVEWKLVVVVPVEIVV